MDEQNLKEAKDIIDKYFQLEKQKSNPTRGGMIKALSEAQRIASMEITAVEHSQGDIYPMFWTDFPDHDLYRKLNQYQQGLLTHCINKYGEELVKKAIKEIAESNK